MATVQEKLKTIQNNIQSACERSNRSKEEVNLVAVTKYVSIDRAREALDAGVHHLGENRLPGAVEKWEAIGNRATWHFIGSLQSKKVKKMIDKYDYIHSLDRLSLAKEIEKRAPENKKIKCFVQVNTSGEESKAGLHPEETPSFISSLQDYPTIEVIGLMTMAPLVDNPEETRPTFQKLRELRDDIRDRNWIHAPCHHLSMGMSNDYEIAIEEGATFIRLGSTLVGKE